MRYYGVSNNQNKPLNPEVEEKPAVTVPMQNQVQPSPAVPDRTFNRPESTSGLYGGQTAQNVTSVREWIDEQPPVVFPPGTEEIRRPTVYEYPASNPSSPQRPMTQNPSAPQRPMTPNPSCQLKTDFSTHLCGHIGDYAYIALSDGMEKRGTVESVGRDFITLSDSGNHIMCPLNAISSINILKPTR